MHSGVTEPERFECSLSGVDGASRRGGGNRRPGRAGEGRADGMSYGGGGERMPWSSSFCFPSALEVRTGDGLCGTFDVDASGESSVVLVFDATRWRQRGLLDPLNPLATLAELIVLAVESRRDHLRVSFFGVALPKPCTVSGATCSRREESDGPSSPLASDADEMTSKAWASRRTRVTPSSGLPSSSVTPVSLISETRCPRLSRREMAARTGKNGGGRVTLGG